MLAVAVGRAAQREAEAREALMHCGDQRVDLRMAGAAHQRVDITRVFGPVVGQNRAAARGVGLVPGLQVGGRDDGCVGHGPAPLMGRRKMPAPPEYAARTARSMTCEVMAIRGSRSAISVRRRPPRFALRPAPPRTAPGRRAPAPATTGRGPCRGASAPATPAAA